ncbi:MAG: hypothetical protein E6R03_13330 [Hyphomicrobiaceae bacterium]|nr:MAG: hypothetical protein E6R03_13330 [Hyphomicrobiaceae bacterium]
MSGAIIGILPSQVTAATAIPAYRLGTRGGYDHPTLGRQEFVYGRANGAITGLGYVCLEATGFDFVLATTTTSAPGSSGPGSRVGVAQAALADNEYGWFQVYGKGSIRTLASAAKGTRLNTTATGGAVDDDGTAGAESITGLVIMTASGGAAETNADGMICEPVVGVTL